MSTITEKVDRLEETLQAFITSVGIEFNKVYNSQLRTESELRAFKDEMRRETREMNRKWGDLANKLGTMVEDLVAPSLPRIVQETLGVEVTDFMVRRKRKLSDGRVFEYDAIAEAGELVVLNSAKSALRAADVDRFVEEIIRFREIFPEYQGRPLAGVLASLAVDEGLVRYAEQAGILVLAVGDQVMELKNWPGFEPRRW